MIGPYNVLTMICFFLPCLHAYILIGSRNLLNPTSLWNRVVKCPSPFRSRTSQCIPAYNSFHLRNLLTLQVSLNDIESNSQRNTIVNTDNAPNYSMNKVFPVDYIPWISFLSIKTDAFEAVDELIASLDMLATINLNSITRSPHSSSSNPTNHKYAMIFYISTIYEMTSFNYEYIFEKISKDLPYVTEVIGCTTGTAVGQSLIYSPPVEAESRPGISAILIPIGDEDSIKCESYSLIHDEYIRLSSNAKNSDDFNSILFGNISASHDSVNILLSSLEFKANLSRMLNNNGGWSDKGAVIGAVASAVTNLQIPKVFRWSSQTGIIEKISQGLVGFQLSGDIDVKIINARSCKPVGPIFRVKETNESNVVSISSLDHSNNEDIAPPLVHLGQVLEQLSPEDSFKLRDELLLSISSEASPDATSILMNSDYTTQKPSSFDQMTGSISLPCIPTGEGDDPLMLQFCVRDSLMARKDLREAMNELKSTLKENHASPSNDEHTPQATPLSVMMLGSIERGNKLFRYANWESGSIYRQLQETGLENLVPVMGLYSNGVFGKTSSPSNMKSIPAIMEHNTLTAVFTRKQNRGVNQKDRVRDSARVADDSSSFSEDVMTSEEIKYFDDSNEGCLVTKRDTDSSHSLRVASMEFYVPEKTPQPSNTLESLVWDREKEVDRFRERFQLNRALVQVKAATEKNPSRNFVDAITRAKANDKPVPLIVEITRGSLFNGDLKEVDIAALSRDVLLQCPAVVSIGLNTDTGVYKGSYEDIETLRSTTKLTGREDVPIICNDFVVYAYQIFQAKVNGADSIKFSASILPIQELAYLSKIAKAFGMTPVVSVASKAQMLSVLQEMNAKDLDVICVTNRNQKLWKIQPNKAIQILDDNDVQIAMNQFRLKKAGVGSLLVLVEGFSDVEDVAVARGRSDVDAIILGEELLRVFDFMGPEASYVDTLKYLTRSD